MKLIKPPLVNAKVIPDILSMVVWIFTTVHTGTNWRIDRLLDTFHLALITHGLYFYLISNYGNLLVIASPTWWVRIHQGASSCSLLNCFSGVSLCALFHSTADVMSLFDIPIDSSLHHGDYHWLRFHDWISMPIFRSLATGSSERSYPGLFGQIPYSHHLLVYLEDECGSVGRSIYPRTHLAHFCPVTERNKLIAGAIVSAQNWTTAKPYKINMIIIKIVTSVFTCGMSILYFLYSEIFDSHCSV